MKHLSQAVITAVGLSSCSLPSYKHQPLCEQAGYSTGVAKYASYDDINTKFLSQFKKKHPMATSLKNLGNVYAFEGVQWLHFYRNMYLYSKDEKWLSLIDQTIVLIISNTDDKVAADRNLQIHYKKSPLALQNQKTAKHVGWSRTDYAANHRVAEVLIDASICNGIFKSTHFLLIENYISQDRQETTTNLCKHILDQYIEDFKELSLPNNKKLGALFYRSQETPKLYFDPIPINHQITSALAYFTLYKFTKADKYLNIADRIISFFVEGLRYNNESSGKTAYWLYGLRSNLTAYKTRDILKNATEDLGHANFVMRDLMALHNSGKNIKYILELLLISSELFLEQSITDLAGKIDGTNEAEDAHIGLLAVGYLDAAVTLGDHKKALQLNCLLKQWLTPKSLSWSLPYLVASSNLLTEKQLVTFSRIQNESDKGYTGTGNNCR